MFVAWFIQKRLIELTVTSVPFRLQPTLYLTDWERPRRKISVNLYRLNHAVSGK